MDEIPRKKQEPGDPPRRPGREIANPNLFSDQIVFSDTEKILFEEDLHDRPGQDGNGLMDGRPHERYTPDRKLNEGGMKSIWEVDDHRTARKVAMALIQDSRIASAEDIESFLYEARLTANLQHPNIIPIYDIALDENGNPYFTMKALKGETLAEILKKLKEGYEEYRRRYTRTRLLGIFLKVCNAIDYAHTKGVIHLDLKPSNVIVGDFGDVHVLDWGLSTLITHLDEEGGEPVSWHSLDEVSLESGETLTRYLENAARRRGRGKVVGGTPGYMSPEQAQGVPSDIDFQTDVYMLGAMLYEILTYQCPIVGATVKEVLHKTVRGELPPPAKRAPGLRIPAALAAIAMKAMQTGPADRYPSVAALIRDIQQYQEGFATIAENPTFLTHATLLVKRHKMAVGLIAAALAVVAAIAGRSYLAISRSERIAVDALAKLREKNEYIAATAKQVAPDYLDLMAQQEKSFQFSAAEQSLDTGLAFDPSLATGWMWKGKILLCRQEFGEAWRILSGAHGHPVQRDTPAVRLAERYKNSAPLPDARLPGLAKDFVEGNVAGGIPRLFYHLNRAPFDPETRFPAITETLRLLNPRVESLHFGWKTAADGGWEIDLSGNANLDDISPLCGLDIRSLDARGTGNPDLRLLTEPGLRKLDLAGTQVSHLPELDQFSDLATLNIRGTRIRNIAGIAKYAKLSELDLGGIPGLDVSQQLAWCRNLKLLTVSESLREDPTIRLLARRGTIIIYSH